MLDNSKVQKDRDARIAALKVSIEKTCAKLSMDSNALEKMSLDEQFPLFAKLLEEASVPVQRQPTIRTQPWEDAIEAAEKEAKAALKSVKKPRWTLEQKQQRQEQRALQGGKEIPRGRSARKKQAAAERDCSIDGGVSLIPKPEVKDIAKPKHSTTILPVRGARKGSINKTATSTTHNTLEEEMVPTNTMSLNPNASVYQSTMAAPLGSSYTSLHQNSQSFIPYQPVRFASSIGPRNAFQPPGKSSSSTNGRLRDSPLRAPSRAKHNVPKEHATDIPLLSGSQKDPRVRRGAPMPTAAYLEQTSLPTRTVSKPGNLLLVLDINGTLLCRKKKTDVITTRPSLADFLDYCLDNHSVLIWSSAQPENVNMMCSKIFSKARRSQIIAEWGRDTLELSAADYYQRTQVYKRLDRVWDNEVVQIHHPLYDQGGRWSQKNTVLIDDSALKALAQPFNHIEVPEFEARHGQGNDGDGTEVLGQVVAYLEELRAWEDVSSFMRRERFVLDGGYRWDWATGRRVCPDMREDL
ncbi:hypothetical protein MMC11_004645 [Xylographa trunciseda]|nr:hypothetical protein [Xylographa trunciseda]